MSDHNPIYHLKDSYFFEVPKALWRRDWQKLEDVPEFLRAPYERDHHPMPSLAEFNEALSGKVLIPQPFGQLDSLYAMKSGIGISKYMLLELAVGGAILLLFAWLAKRIASGAPAKGRLANLLEAMLVFVRDQIARPAIDDKHAHADEHGHVHHDGDKFVPLLWTLFFFILGCNLLGMVPWAGSPTASFSVTLALAAATFLGGFVGGVKAMGLAGYFKAGLSAQVFGVGKPDRRIFEAAAQAAGVPPDEVLHIGDDAELDVLAALACGMQTAWVNRDDKLWPHAAEPHETVRSLAELTALF